MQFSGLDGFLADDADVPGEPAPRTVIISSATTGEPETFPKASLLMTGRPPSTEVDTLRKSLADITHQFVEIHGFEGLGTETFEGKYWIVHALEHFSLQGLSPANFETAWESRRVVGHTWGQRQCARGPYDRGSSSSGEIGKCGR